MMEVVLGVAGPHLGEASHHLCYYPLALHVVPVMVVVPVRPVPEHHLGEASYRHCWRFLVL